ncbi:hypothetical protein T09_15746 [Trichinella sp. T9]|nr:hypothetical protein T09_15746 [Trichinella sp. T9]
MPYFAGFFGMYCLNSHGPLKGYSRSSTVTFSEGLYTLAAVEDRSWGQVDPVDFVISWISHVRKVHTAVAMNDRGAGILLYVDKVK